MDLENTIRTILAEKGYRMSDIASKMGVTQSNLVASIRKNPKLSTILDLANALGCSVTDLLQPKTLNNGALGIAVIDGVTYQLSKPDYSCMQLPVYTDHQELRYDIREFVRRQVTNDSGNRVVCGLVESVEFFTLFFDAPNAVFHLALCYEKGKTMTFDYRIGDFDEPVNIESLYGRIITDIEQAVVNQFDTFRKNVTDYYSTLIKEDQSKVEEPPQPHE